MDKRLQYGDLCAVITSGRGSEWWLEIVNFERQEGEEIHFISIPDKSEYAIPLSCIQRAYRKIGNDYIMLDEFEPPEEENIK